MSTHLAILICVCILTCHHTPKRYEVPLGNHVVSFEHLVSVRTAPTDIIATSSGAVGTLPLHEVALGVKLHWESDASGFHGFGAAAESKPVFH